MQRVSTAYKKEQLNYLRNENYVYVYLGVISREAQSNAYSNGGFTIYSSPQSVFSNNDFEAYYTSADENYCKVNDSMYFMPRDYDCFALWQGLVTQEIADSVTFTFLPYKRLDIKGLTIDFGDYYPTSFSVTNGNIQYTYDYTNDHPGVWDCEDVFRNTAQITIIPHQMVGGRQRLRIHSILFGKGLMFDNNSLISTSWKQECAHISNKLPSKQFSFTISNLDRKFAADDPHSWASFLQERQDVEFHYGRKLDDGSIYIIKGGKLKLKSWSSDDAKSKFTCVGFMDYMSGTYNKGQYYPDGISYWDLARDVCEDAGLENYIIDNWLKTLYTHNPLPVEKHKNLLQLIANASQSILYETRDGALEIKSSFEPNITNISSNGATIYSNLDNIVEEDVACQDYASNEKDYVFTDGKQFFLPRVNRSGYVETGYISQHVSKADGTFITNPTLTIEWEASWTFFNLYIVFGDVKPLEYVIRTYHYDTLVDTVYSGEEIQFTDLVEWDFYELNKLVIEFTKTNPYQRIHVKKLRFGDLSDYSIDYRDMKESPKAVTAEFVKNVTVNYYEYAYGNENKQIGTTKAVIGENKVIFSKPHHDYSLSYKDGGSGTLTLNESGAYYIDFTSSRAAEVNVKAYEFNVTQKEVVNEVHEIGVDKVSKNVIIDNEERALGEAYWLGDHFDNDIDYTITYRGEPALDADDQIYTENKYVEKNMVRVVSNQIDTSTGMMNCRLKARRTRYIEPALVDVAIVDESEVE